MDNAIYLFGQKTSVRCLVVLIAKRIFVRRNRLKMHERTCEKKNEIRKYSTVMQVGVVVDDAFIFSNILCMEYCKLCATRFAMMKSNKISTKVLTQL